MGVSPVALLPASQQIRKGATADVGHPADLTDAQTVRPDIFPRGCWRLWVRQRQQVL